MIWEFGELGYNYSINSNEKGEVSDDYRTAPNPIHWEYYNNASRKGLYDVYAKLMTIRNANPELFEGNATMDWKVTANDSEMRTRNCLKEMQQWIGKLPQTIGTTEDICI